MLATIEFTTVETQLCPGCGRRHRHRVALSDESTGSPDGPVLYGFFARCPATGRRNWFVVELPRRAAAGIGARIGPADDPDWEPIEQALFGTPRGPVPLVPPRGKQVGGFRVNGRSPDLLRLALGCPFNA